jgi:N-acetylmuramoyl-L-alanine amidase
MRKVWGVLLAWGLLWVVFFSVTDTKVEVTEVTWEPIPVEQHVECVEQEEVPAHTHDVKVNVNEFTYKEAQDLLRVAQAEAGNQGEDGMWLVMSVVFNRRENKAFPDNIHDVIYQDHQFSTVTNGSIDRVEVSNEAHLALARVERGEVAPEIVAFETVDSSVLDKYFTQAFEYRDHRFYTERIDEDN